MRISVIVPTYNEGKTIERCLKALKNQTFKDYEIVVIDGHSKDNTVEIAKKYADRILYDEGKGAGAARNLAVRAVDSEIVAFVDGDTVVPENWVETVSAALEGGVVGVGGPVSPEGGGLLDKIVYFICADLVRRISSALGSHHFTGANCAFLRSAFFQARGFREDLDMIDDADLSMRMKKFGKVKFEPKLYAVTSMRRSKQKGHLRTIWEFIRGYISLFSTGQVKKRGYLREIKKE
ncbi:MAG: glycosyltransferase [Candidatus Hodarchaeaceae archaeon]|nr:glycosyltransferase [Candidatus Hodarchaeaceae archaeon]